MEYSYKIGDKLVEMGSSDRYLLCQVGYLKCCLVNISTGNRWSEEPVLVKNPERITEEEFVEMSSSAGGYPARWEHWVSGGGYNVG
jgi:hypothetical protein